jgi:hypothetical protein
MLTGEGGRTKRVTGEVRPHCGKTSKKRTSGVWHSGLNAILLQRTLSRRASAFQRDQSRAILPSIRVGWAAYLGNVGLGNAEVEKIMCDFTQIECPAKTFVPWGTASCC